MHKFLANLKRKEKLQRKFPEFFFFLFFGGGEGGGRRIKTYRQVPIVIFFSFHFFSPFRLSAVELIAREYYRSDKLIR